MYTIRLQHQADFEGWRSAARLHLLAATRPENLIWVVNDESANMQPTDLFTSDAIAPDTSRAQVPPLPTVPRQFMDLAERVVCHRDRNRFALLYKVLWRRTHGDEPHLLLQPHDPDLHRLEQLGKVIARERHKTHAFVRFRQTSGMEPEHFHAWFEPEHHSLRLSAPFFVRRFANMRWSIVTPEESAHWDGEQLKFGIGGSRNSGPDTDMMEALWKTYFANIFNPARLMTDAMQAEMPVKYWKNLPEAPLIAELTRQAGTRSASMVDTAGTTASRFARRATAPVIVSNNGQLAIDTSLQGVQALHAQASACQDCPHAIHATQAVNGEGRVGASLFVIGEQPGDVEDRQGRPFVGPAGQLLRELLQAVNVDTDDVYLTNAVRHFGYEVRGKRRIHKTPSRDVIERCRPLLFREIENVKPRAVLMLGGTAGRAVLDRAVSVDAERGSVRRSRSGMVLVQSMHPSRILRCTDEREITRLKMQLRADVELAWQHARDRNAVS